MRLIKGYFALGICALLGAAMVAEDYPVVEVLPIECVGIDPDEARTIEDLIVSYATEIEGFKIVDPGTGSLSAPRRISAAPSVDAQYRLSGRLARAGERLSLSLELTETATSRKLSQAGAYDTMNELVLSLRGQVRALFSMIPPATAIPAAPPSSRADRLTPAMVAGTWKGDDGLVVRLFKDGTGLAQFPSGKTMKLIFAIEDGTRLVVAQNQPNAPEFYLKPPRIPYPVAKLIAERARPMRWILAPGADGRTLSGTKETVAVVVSGDGAIESLDNGYVKDVGWTRLS